MGPGGRWPVKVKIQFLKFGDIFIHEYALDSKNWNYFSIIFLPLLNCLPLSLFKTISTIVEDVLGHGRGWNKMIYKVPSKPNHSRVL